MDKESRDLLLGITRCPNLAAARKDAFHPCSTIVSLQSGDECHVPEPWCGHIDTAPILFVSSNPSISEVERFPTPSWLLVDTADFFEGRFDADAGHITPRAYNGVRFWSSVRARAREILGRDATPGIDFALTEVVHCKSRQEKDVAAAMGTCAERWLCPVLAQSEALVVVLLGIASAGGMLQDLGSGRVAVGEFRRGPGWPGAERGVASASQRLRAQNSCSVSKRRRPKTIARIV